MGYRATITPKMNPKKISPPTDHGHNQSNYVDWLEQQSMLYQGGLLAQEVSGDAEQWRHPYASPQSKGLLNASVWFSAYPNAILTHPGDGILTTLAGEKLWKTFQELGIQAMHLGPVRLAGGISEREHTPTIDGWFDRIGLDVDPAFGTDEDYRRLAATA